MSTAPQWYLGLMTGTSFDGIDAGLLRTDGVEVVEFGATLTVPHPPERKIALAAVMGRRSAPLELIEELTDAHQVAAEMLLAKTGISRDQVRAIGFHGQTILHAPRERLTIQIGDGQRLARALGITVIDQFRTADVQAGGEGAPLAPVFHRELLRRFAQPAAIINIGGVANITWTDGDRLVAFDTGPGNAGIDDLMRTRCGRDYDEDGAIAASGTVQEAVVSECLRDPFFARRPPKSLDRQEITCPDLDLLSTEDAAATLAAITADSIASAGEYLPSPPSSWVISGGGRHNLAIMRRLKAKVLGRVMTAEEAGWDGDGMESFLFAYLAARRMRGLPSSYPETTGVPNPTVCGIIRPA